jgi:membrane associated rhomboid family serine protease
VIIVPIGHDQSVYGRQWVVRLLLVINAAVFALTYLAGRGADEAIDKAASALDRVVEEYPEGRVPPQSVASLPPGARARLKQLVAASEEDTQAEGSLAVDRAVRRLVVAVESQPHVRYGYRPGKPSVIGFFTSTFMHADLMHLVGNLLFLWLAGAVIECFWEAGPFTILYLLSGCAGTLAHHLSAPSSMIPLVGASGAIAGLMGAFVVGHPETRIRMFYALWVRFGTVTVPAWVLIPAWFVLQVGYAFVDSNGGVAYWAHVGGFLTGVAGALVMRWGNWVSYDAARIVKS